MLEQAVVAARPRPPDSAARDVKKNYAERLSREIAKAISADLSSHGLTGCQPDASSRGSDREFAGGIGAKKVDVSWATDWAGLLLGVSVKTINFPDPRTKNYQKNLMNRRSDMLFESVTIHRRFPYAVLGGIMFLHVGASTDGTAKRDSTYQNAQACFRIFTDRTDPGGREEQYERIYLALYDDTTPSVTLRTTGVTEPYDIPWDSVRLELLQLVAERNPDHFVFRRGKLERR